MPLIVIEGVLLLTIIFRAPYYIIYYTSIRDIPILSRVSQGGQSGRQDPGVVDSAPVIANCSLDVHTHDRITVPSVQSFFQRQVN